MAECLFCGRKVATLSHGGNEEGLTATPIGKRWICNGCAQELKDVLGIE